MAKRKIATVISVEPRRVQLKRQVRRHLAELGFIRTAQGNLQLPGSGKDVVRRLHAPQRNQVIERQKDFIAKRGASLLQYFASGLEVVPERVAPRLERIYSDTWQSELFKLASLTWSVPVSSGFGRRLRFLVWDDQNEKLIGILAIGDPVFNLSVRDKYIGWTGADRKERLVNVMDAYVLGAVPPYNQLLGGKLVASLIRTRDLYDEFDAAYGTTTGIISKQVKHARLLAVTTSSSMGRSSVYNRLKLDGVEHLRSIGYSGGWGHFHVPDDLFSEMRTFLRDIGHEYADLHAFGQGPNWRIRTIRAALGELGFRGDMLKHGIQREVFISCIASNSIELLAHGRGKPDLTSLRRVEDVGRLAVERWVISRATARPEYRSWKKEQIMSLVRGETRAAPTNLEGFA